MSEDFSARYRLLKCVLVEDGTRTHNAQELSTGRVVMVHITDAAGPDEVDILHSQLASLPAADKNKVLEAVTLPSGFAVVTEFLSAPLTFRSWLAAHATGANATAAPSPAHVSGHSATIPSPPDPNDAQADEPPLEMFSDVSVATPTEIPEALPGSFSQIFGHPEPPAAPAAIEYPLPSSSHVAVDLSSLAPNAPPVVPPPPPAPPATPVPTAPAARAPGPGEFTRMFAPSADEGAITPPSFAPPVVAPPVIAAPVIAPPVVAPPVAAPSVAAPPVVAPPILSPPIFATAAPPAAPPAVPPSAPPAAAPIAPPIASPLTAASSFGYSEVPTAPPLAKKTPGEFTMMFGAPETAAPLPETMRPSPMREAPPPTFSPITPNQRLESPPVEPMHRVITNNPNYVAGIHQDGPSPIAPNIVGGNQYGGLPPLMPLAPQPAAPPAHASPLFAAAGPPSVDRGPAMPGILPPPIFSSGTSTPLSALGGAAPLVNASAGPSEFTRLISNAAEPVVPPLAPSGAMTPGRAGASEKRRLPNGLIIVINAVLLIAALLIFFVLRRPVPTKATLTPARPVMPSMPTAPKIPTR